MSFEEKDLAKRALSGDSDAQYFLALIYCADGDVKPAKSLLRMAKESGHKDAERFLYHLEWGITC